MSRSFKVDMCEAVSLGEKLPENQGNFLCELPKSHLNFRLKNCTTVKRRQREDGMEEERREERRLLLLTLKEEEMSKPLPPHTHILFQEGRKKFGSPPLPLYFLPSRYRGGGICSQNCSRGLKSMFLNIYEQF